MSENVTPRGELTIQTIAMPADTNANGDIFGGWIVSQMDLAAGIVAKQKTKGRVATVAIKSMVFKRPVQVGDLVAAYGSIESIGTTSMTIHIQVWVTDHHTGKRQQVTEGTFVFVALDEKGRPCPVEG